MKHFSIFTKVIYILFIALTAGFLILIVLSEHAGLSNSFWQNYALLYLIILVISLITLIVNTVITLRYRRKTENRAAIVKRAVLSLLIGFALGVVFSLIKYKVFFSMEYWAVPIALLLSSVMIKQREI